VRTCHEFADEDKEPSYEQLQQIYHNTQASSVLLSSLEKDEFDRVNGLETAKDICDHLQRAYEGTKPMKKVKGNSLKDNSLKGNLIGLSQRGFSQPTT
jgi:hypothetical protein